MYRLTSWRGPTVLNSNFSLFWKAHIELQLSNTRRINVTTMVSKEIPQPLEVLLLLENTTYKCTDYLERASQAQCLSDSAVTINESWREKICKWTFEVIDHFEFQRETAYIALSYLDRFLSNRLVNHRTFQLASMTTLYLAIKLYEPRTLRISSLTELSRGLFVEQQVAAMELLLLRWVSWSKTEAVTFFFEFFIDQISLFSAVQWIRLESTPTNTTELCWALSELSQYWSSSTQARDSRYFWFLDGVVCVWLLFCYSKIVISCPGIHLKCIGYCLP